MSSAVFNGDRLLERLRHRRDVGAMPGGSVLLDIVLNLVGEAILAESLLQLLPKWVQLVLMNLVRRQYHV